MQGPPPGHPYRLGTHSRGARTWASECEETTSGAPVSPRSVLTGTRDLGHRVKTEYILSTSFGIFW